MKSFDQGIYAALIIACILSITQARPQQFSRPGANPWNQPNPQNPFLPPQQQPQGNGTNNNNNNNNNINDNSNISTTTPIPATATTASPAFLACMQRCGTTMEYNPVCGSDGINYHNDGRLRCAALCGKSVVATRMGTCSAL